MVGVKSCANGQTFVSGGGLDVGAAEWRSAEQLSVGNAVQSTTAGHGEIFIGHPLMELVQKVEEDLLKRMLHRIGKVHIALRNLRVGLARWSKQLLHLPGKMWSELYGSIGKDLHSLGAAQRFEILQVEMEVAVPEADDISHFAAEGVLSVRRQPHDFAFVSILLVTDELANHGVEASE